MTTLNFHPNVVKLRERIEAARSYKLTEWPSITLAQASQKTGYHIEYLRTLIKSAKIEAIKVGNLQLIRVSSLDAYVDAAKRSGDGRRKPKKLG